MALDLSKNYFEELQIANISKEYLRDFSDWFWLCRKCHAKYDDYVNKSWITRKAVVSYGA